MNNKNMKWLKTYQIFGKQIHIVSHPEWFGVSILNTDEWLTIDLLWTTISIQKVKRGLRRECNIIEEATDDDMKEDIDNELSELYKKLITVINSKN